MGLGKFVVNKLLKFPRGSILSFYTQLYVNFFLSGLLHFSGDFVVEKRVVYRSFKFFLLQPAAITFEALVIYIAKRWLRRGGIELKPGETGESRAEMVGRVIGHCWVTLWISLTFPGWLDELNAIGFGIIDRKPITQFLLNKWHQWA